MPGCWQSGWVLLARLLLRLLLWPEILQRESLSAWVSPTVTPGLMQESMSRRCACKLNASWHKSTDRPWEILCLIASVGHIFSQSMMHALSPCKADVSAGIATRQPTAQKSGVKTLCRLALSDRLPAVTLPAILPYDSLIRFSTKVHGQSGWRTSSTCPRCNEFDSSLQPVLL